MVHIQYTNSRKLVKIKALYVFYPSTFRSCTVLQLPGSLDDTVFGVNRGKTHKTLSMPHPRFLIRPLLTICVVRLPTVQGVRTSLSGLTETYPSLSTEKNVAPTVSDPFKGGVVQLDAW